jgi:hypothetical protein
MTALLRINLDAICDSSSLAFQQFRQVVPDTTVSTDTLMESGHQIKAAGTAHRVRLPVVELAPGHSIPLLAPFTGTWNEFDHAYPYSYQPSEKRRSRYPRWAQNLCALEALIGVAITMKLGVRQADALSFEAMRRLPKPAAAMRALAESPWETLNSKQRNGLRDMVAQAYEEWSGGTWRVGNYADANELVLTLFKAFPSFQYITLDQYICCDGNALAADPPEIKRHITHSFDLAANLDGQDVVHFAGQSLSTAFCSFFAPFHTRVGKPSNLTETGDVATPFTPCTAGTHCRGIYSRRYGLLGRPPVSLMVNVGGGDVSHNSYRRYTDDLRVEFSVPVTSDSPALLGTLPYGPTMVATYSLESATFLVSAHYISRSKGVRDSRPNAITQQSGFEATATDVPGWLKGLPWSPSPSHITGLYYNLQSISSRQSNMTRAWP